MLLYIFFTTVLVFTCIVPWVDSAVPLHHFVDFVLLSMVGWDSFLAVMAGVSGIVLFLGGMGVLVNVEHTRWSYWGLGIFVFFLGGMGTLGIEFFFLLWCYGVFFRIYVFVCRARFFFDFWILYENLPYL